MKISVITINYNNAFGLEKTISSVITQTSQPFEFIIIDGGSTDGSIEVIYNNLSNISFWISEKDSGIYNAMNKGITIAKGDYFVFLNSGDCFHTFNIIDRCNTFIKNYPTVDILYGNILIVNDVSNKQRWIKTYPEEVDLHFFKNDTLNHQASLIKSDLFKELGFYPEHYRLASDYWLYLLCLLSGKKFKFIDLLIIDYDLGGITGLNYAPYAIEKNQIWNNLVPDCVNKSINETEFYKMKYEKFEKKYNNLANKKLIKVARQLKSFFKGFRLNN